MLSIEVVDRVFHVVGQVQGVVTDKALRELAVASLARLDDVHVVDDRALGPVVLADGPAPDRPHMHEQVLDQLPPAPGIDETVSIDADESTSRNVRISVSSSKRLM